MNRTLLGGLIWAIMLALGLVLISAPLWSRAHAAAAPASAIPAGEPDHVVVQRGPDIAGVVASRFDLRFGRTAL